MPLCRKNSSEIERRLNCVVRLVFQNKQCRNCHSLGGLGGQRGPALDEVATRLTKEELVRQVIQGGGNMPAYGKKLSPAEVDALVAFMGTLHSTAPVGPRIVRKIICRVTWQPLYPVAMSVVSPLRAR